MCRGSDGPSRGQGKIGERLFKRQPFNRQTYINPGSGAPGGKSSRGEPGRNRAPQQGERVSYKNIYMCFPSDLFSGETGGGTAPPKFIWCCGTPVPPSRKVCQKFRGHPLCLDCSPGLAPYRAAANIIVRFSPPPLKR